MAASVDAREHLRAAHEQFTAIGMEAFAERARVELLATGEIVGSRRQLRTGLPQLDTALTEQ